MPNKDTDKIFSILNGLGESSNILVETIPGFLNHKIGFEPLSRNITILVECLNSENLVFNKGGGKYLTIAYDIKCIIKQKNKRLEKNKKYTVITLKSKEKDVENYFIELCIIFLKKLGNKPQIADVKIQFEKLESIFAKLSRISNKSIIGLWGELFLISLAKNPEYMIMSWHKNQNDKFDFNDGIDKLEVKTTSLNRRYHNFEILQLQVFKNSLTVIASIITSETDNGNSIGDLINLIKNKVSIEVYENLISKIFDVIGNRINEINDIKFDSKMAQSEIKFYLAEDIPKPELIPKTVLGVKFQSDLGGAKSMPQNKFKNKLLNSFK